MQAIATDRRYKVDFLRDIRLAIVFAIIASGLSGVASATGTQWTASLQISSIEVVGTTSGFVVYLTGFSDSNCSSNPTGIYFYPNAGGVSQTAVNQILATALAARAAGTPVSVLYNDSGNVSAGLCYGQYLVY